MGRRETNQIYRKRKVVAFVIFPLIIIGAAAIYFYLQYKKTHISTDDAYVEGRVHTVASKIFGTVKTLYIQDNQLVKAGDLLLESDPKDYQVKVKEARAGLEAERAKLTQILNSVDTVNKQLAQIIASLEAAKSNLKLQEANLLLAELEFKRSEALFQKAVIARQQYDQAKTAYEVSKARVTAAADNVKGLEASVETHKALIRQTESEIPPQQGLIKQNEMTVQAADWFSSNFIIYMTVISASSLVLFVAREFLTESPVLNIRIFKNISFSTGNLIMFIAFFSLFSSIVLLPIYLETLMGYTAYLSGLVLGPGGVAAMVAMPIAGQLVNRINPKWIITFGNAVTAYSVHLMSLFNLQADFYAILWPRVVMGFGIGFLFVPLTTVTMSGVNKEQMGNATAIFNLLRNLGGSFGVAFVTTLLAGREQFHQFRLVEHLTPFNLNFQKAVPQIQQLLRYQGLTAPVPGHGVVGLIYNNLLQQAAVLSFNDCFFVVSIMMTLILPFVLLMKRPKEGRPQVIGVH
jgi:hypothetical protein